MIDLVSIVGVASGVDGSAVVTAYSPHVSGKVEAVHVSYAGDKPATTDVTLQDEGDPASENIVTLTDNVTDTKIYPRRVIELNDGTDITYDGTNEVYDKYAVFGRLKMSVAGANDGDVITVNVWLDS